MTEATHTIVHLLSGGAAQGLVDTLKTDIAAMGIKIEAVFGAVGLMQDKMLGGEPCDIFISTGAMLRTLAEQGRLEASSIRPLGSVATGIAVKAGAAVSAVDSAANLRAVLLAAPEVHCPDTRKSTAGIHFAQVLLKLGIAAALVPRLHTHPNGMTAMRAVAASAEPAALGCTQITEILHTPGVVYAGDLPGEFSLHTVYAAALAPDAPAAAHDLLELLCGHGGAATRQHCGFKS